MDIDDSMTDIVWRWRGHKDSNPGTNLLGMQNISFWVRATLGLWEESTSLHLGQTHKHSVTSSRCQRVWMLIVHYSTLIGYTSSPSPSAVFAICFILKLPLQQSQGKGLNIGPQIRRHTKYCFLINLLRCVVTVTSLRIHVNSSTWPWAENWIPNNNWFTCLFSSTCSHLMTLMSTHLSCL